MPKEVILCLIYLDSILGPNLLYCSSPLNPQEHPDLGRILEFAKEEGNFIFSFRKYQTINHIFYIDSELARGGKELLMITYMIKTVYIKDEITDVYHFLLSKTTDLESYASELKTLQDLTKLLHSHKNRTNQKEILNEASKKFKKEFFKLFNIYYPRLSQDYSLAMFPQLNQKEILQKLDSLENKFSKQLELKESELRLKERELKLKEEQLIKIYTVEELPDIRRNIVIFVSYATRDANLFKIKELAEILTSYEKIDDVLYWQEDLKDNIITYMSDNLDKCDVMLLFCSPNALKSKPIEKEWTAADMMNKPIIPVFIKTDHIPPLLKSRLGVEFNNFDLKKTIDEIYEIILKKFEQRIIEIKDLRTDF